MIRFWAVIFFFVLSGNFVLAEENLIEPKLLPIPSKRVIAPRSLSSIDKELPLDVDHLAGELKSQFDRYIQIADQKAPACSESGATDYALSLQVKGKFDECVQYAQTCAGSSQTSSPRVISRGGACLAAQYQYDLADRLYQSAVDKRFSSSPDYADVIYDYAAFSMYGIHAEKAPKILALNSAWKAEELALWEALIKRVGRLDLGKIQKPEIDAFLDQQIKAASGAFLIRLKSLRMAILSGDYKYDEAIAALDRDAPTFNNPLLWYDSAYVILYHGLDTNFSEARKIYDVSDQYSNPFSVLPNEENTYNYTEIYKSICKDHLLTDADGKAFADFKGKIRSGALSSQEALEQAATWVARFPDRADVLTSYGGLLALTGQHKEAMSTYWQAHRQCRYFNRANWGLTLEKRFIKYTSMPDYKSNEDKVERELGSRQIPQDISTYISDWNALDASTQRRIEYGMRIWLPWVSLLKTSGYSTYIKFAFDLLSDSPNSSDLRDERIGGQGYPNDNRLWDDVRGAGGDTVIADASEVFQTVQGDYNLLGHEMTHQFQGLLEAKSPVGIACVQKIYDTAKSAKNFPDAYSSQNKEEHFAQGVTYYLVPQDSPQRFGLNQKWLVDHNPQQLAFIQSIESAAGELNKISCQ